MALRGRGRNYRPLRGAVEAVLERAYAGGWPARVPGARAAVRARHFMVEVLGLAPGRTLRVGFASDLHAGPTTPQQTIEEAFAALRAFEPDLLLLGGDYVLFDAQHADALVRPIRSIAAPLGRFAVLGNHDLWADDRHIAAVLERAGATVLTNDAVQVEGAPFLSIGGLDDHWTGAPDYAAAFGVRAAVHLLLMHSPDHAENLADRAFSLALCGHTHGGQVSLPGGKPLVMPTEPGRRFPHGRFELPGGPMLVSRGVGNVEVPFRAFAPPDVLCVTLVPKRAA